MELNVQNSNFLSFLSKLDIDVKQFPEKTFDGLFENVPELANYFFNWLIENITPENALTQSEQATYFQLANSKSLPSEEEVNYVLSNCSPTYEEVVSLDFNYVDNTLSEQLDDLKKNFAELSDMNNKIECAYNEIKKEQNNLKESINARKKFFSIMKEGCQGVNSSFGNKLEEVKLFLLEEPCLTLDFNLFFDLLAKERNILHEFESHKLLDSEICNFSQTDDLNLLKENLQYVEISTVLSEGFVRSSRAKLDFLTKFNENRILKQDFSYQNFVATDYEEVEKSLIEEIKALETEIFAKLKILSHQEVKKITDQYISNKLDLIQSYLNELNNCKNFMKSNLRINLCFLHILLRSKDSLENTAYCKEQLELKLNEYELNFTKDITNFELRKQRYEELATNENQNSVLSVLKSVMYLEENPENNEETLKKVFELMLHASDESNFITHGFRSDLQSAIKGLFNTTLCGPTSQILLIPVELLMKLQDCEHLEKKLSQEIKQLVNKYVGAKAKASKNERKVLLLWIDFLTNPEVFLKKMAQMRQAKYSPDRVHLPQLPPMGDK